MSIRQEIWPESLSAASDCDSLNITKDESTSPPRADTSADIVALPDIETESVAEIYPEIIADNYAEIVFDNNIDTANNYAQVNRVFAEDIPIETRAQIHAEDHTDIAANNPVSDDRE